MLNFLYVAVSWVLLRWHQLLSFLGMSPDGGATWALSIVLLVATARLLLFRLFVKQVHYQRNMQKMQPKIQKIREKYKHDRAEMNRQMMKFQQEEGFNPVSGCLPMFLQIPVFLGLYHVLRHLSNSVKLCDHPGALSGHQQSLLSLYTFSGGAGGETCSGAKANLFGAPLAASFRDSAATVHTLGGDITSTRWVILPLLVISAVATLATQLMIRANATTTPEGTAATVQRLMMYIIPAGVLVSGLLFNFPLGVLLYWFTSNIWTFLQQAYIIRFHPPVDEPVQPVGELGKTLAPRPGQRPVRMAKGKQADASDDQLAAARSSTANGGAKANSAKGTSGTGVGSNSLRSNAPAAGQADSAGAAADSQPARGSVPRPGQRPNRANGKRPPAKRPTQAKKRR